MVSALHLPDDEHSLFHGDCLDILPRLPDGCADMILCDLPYGTTKNRWDTIIPFEPLWREYWRVLSAGGVVALTASQPFTSVAVVSQIKFFRHEWIWNKSNGSNYLNATREPLKEHESVLIFSKGKWTYNRQLQLRNGGGLSRIKYAFKDGNASDNYGEHGKAPPIGELRIPSSVQAFKNEKGEHPTQKPVTLMEYLIRTYTDEDATVLDNCMGSGSTGVACERTGRRFVGIEKDATYFATAQRRMLEAAQ